MLHLRQEQVDALDAAYREEFIRRTRKDFRSRWADECAELADSDLDDMLRAARDRAEVHGIEKVGDVVIFTEAWLLLGDDFDTDPAYPWADEILGDSEMSGAAKAAAVRHQTLSVLESVVKLTPTD
ncbi:hypothetical protein N9F46_00480 [bacterium]|nr:hypothetical protein [bacterium]